MSQFSCNFSFGSHYHLKERFSPPRRALFPEFDKENNYQNHTLLSQKDVCFTDQFFENGSQSQKSMEEELSTDDFDEDFDKDDALLGSNEDNELNTPYNLVSADVDSFIADNRASNTVKKTNSGLNTWYRWCKSVKEFRKVEDNPINELNSLLCHFFIKVRKVRPGKDGDYEHEPSCLSDFQKSLDRHNFVPKAFTSLAH